MSSSPASLFKGECAMPGLPFRAEGAAGTLGACLSQPRRWVLGQGASSPWPSQTQTPCVRLAHRASEPPACTFNQEHRSDRPAEVLREELGPGLQPSSLWGCTWGRTVQIQGQAPESPLESWPLSLGTSISLGFLVRGLLCNFPVQTLHPGGLECNLRCSPPKGSTEAGQFKSLEVTKG